LGGGPTRRALTRGAGNDLQLHNGAAHVLGFAIARATGSPLAAFAEEHLFAPLGIDDYRWPTCG